MDRIILTEKDYTYDVLNDGSVVIYVPSTSTTARLNISADVISNVVSKNTSNYEITVEPYADTIKAGFIDGKYVGDGKTFYIQTETKTINVNGSYKASDGKLIDRVIVNVPHRQLYAPTISISNNKYLSIVDTQNGTFVDNYDIYANDEVIYTATVAQIANPLDLDVIVGQTGLYTIKVKATGVGMSDSPFSNEESYGLYEQLATPVISINTDTDYLSITPVEHVYRYKIYADGNTYDFNLLTTNTSINLESWLGSNWDTYEVSAQAIGSGAYTDSEISDSITYLYTQRLASPIVTYAPENVGGIISITDTTEAGGAEVQSYDIYIGGAYYDNVNRTSTTTNVTLDIDDFSTGRHSVYARALRSGSRSSDPSNVEAFRVYTVSCNIENGSIDAPSKAFEKGVVEGEITPLEGYVNPISFSIDRAQLQSYDFDTGILTIDSVSGNTTINASCELPFEGATLSVVSNTLIITSHDTRVSSYDIYSDGVEIDDVDRTSSSQVYYLSIDDFDVGTHSIVVHNILTIYGETYDVAQSSSISINVFSISYNLVNGSSKGNSPTKVFAYSSSTLTVEANAGYVLPSTINVFGASLTSYIPETGVVRLGLAQSNIIVFGECIPKLGTSESVSVNIDTYTFSNVTNATSYRIYIDGNMTTTIPAQSGSTTSYTIPSTLSIGSHTIANVAQASGYIDGDMSANAYVQLNQVTYGIMYGTVSADSPTKIFAGQTFTATIQPDEGYVYPVGVSVTGGTIVSYSSSTGVLSVTGLFQVNIMAMCSPSLPAPSISISGDLLTISYVGPLTSFNIYANDTVVATTPNTLYNLASIDIPIPGTYAITVTANATGYEESPHSNSVNYYLGWYYPTMVNGRLTITQVYASSQSSNRISIG